MPGTPTWRVAWPRGGRVPVSLPGDDPGLDGHLDLLLVGQVRAQAQRALQLPGPGRLERDRHFVRRLALGCGLYAEPRVGAGNAGEAERGGPADDEPPLGPHARLDL